MHPLSLVRKCSTLNARLGSTDTRNQHTRKLKGLEQRQNTHQNHSNGKNETMKKMLGTSTRNDARSSLLAQNLKQEDTNSTVAFSFLSGARALRSTDLGLRPIFLQVTIRAHCAQRNFKIFSLMLKTMPQATVSSNISMTLREQAMVSFFWDLQARPLVFNLPDVPWSVT